MLVIHITVRTWILSSWEKRRRLRTSDFRDLPNRALIYLGLCVCWFLLPHPPIACTRGCTLIYFANNVCWRCTLVYIVYQQRILVSLIIPEEVRPNYKPNSVVDCPSLSSFEILISITFLLPASIGYLSCMEEGVYELTPTYCISACSLLWFRIGYYLVWLIVLWFFNDMVK